MCDVKRTTKEYDKRNAWKKTLPEDIQEKIRTTEVCHFNAGMFCGVIITVGAALLLRK